jgi:hypothetical protein
MMHVPSFMERAEERHPGNLLRVCERLLRDGRLGQGVWQGAPALDQHCPL